MLEQCRASIDDEERIKPSQTYEMMFHSDLGSSHLSQCFATKLAVTTQLGTTCQAVVAGLQPIAESEDEEAPRPPSPSQSPLPDRIGFIGAGQVRPYRSIEHILKANDPFSVQFSMSHV